MYKLEFENNINKLTKKDRSLPSVGYLPHSRGYEYAVRII